MMFFRYVAFHYLKKMLILLVGLSGLFAGLDYMANGSTFSSFNLKILYAFSKWEEALNIFYPLVIVFAGIWTKISFIKQNAESSFYALGFTRKDFFKPFFLVAFLTYLLFVGLNFTSFATANETAYMLKQNKYAISKTEDLFFKYNNSFVYIRTLIPQLYKIENLTIFRLKDTQISETFTAKEAWYNIHEWVASDVLKKTKIVDRFGGEYLKIEHLDILYTLRNYQPKILRSLYENEALTLGESILAKKLLENQGLETYALRADIYNRMIIPLFSIALLMILIFRFPFHARYMNISGTTTQVVGGTLFVWGVLFALVKVAKNGTILPELATILPITLLLLYGLSTYLKSDSQI